MRLLLADAPVTDAPALGSSLADADLLGLYAVPRTSGRWLRANFVASVDGAVSGVDGRSGTVNTAADHVVFELLRALSDVVILGAGTARAEDYGPVSVAERWRSGRAELGLAPELPLVVVSRGASVPPKLGGTKDRSVLLATHAGAPGLGPAREQLGADQVIVCGSSEVDLARLLAQLAERGWTRLLTEGGPRLFGSMLGAGLVEELCLSVTPRVLAGPGPRIVAAGLRDDAFVPRVLVEQGGTLMGRWVRAGAATGRSTETNA